MRIKFRGVRGSIASPGAETADVGGNTSSVEVVFGAGEAKPTRILLDAGTGLRRLGDALLADGPVDATLLLSHLHWDHIQGLPFFVPAYVPTTKLAVVAGANGVVSLRDALARQMSAPGFPVRHDELGAEITLREVRAGERFEAAGAAITAAKLNHPGGVFAYRIEHGGRAMVYATDTEHYACVDPALVALAAGADVLIYDAQYTPEEYAGEVGRSRVGWGHSTFVAGVEVARAAGVGKLVLFHHDPSRNDAAVEAIEAKAQRLFAETVAAREGLVLDLDGADDAGARSRDKALVAA